MSEKATDHPCCTCGQPAVQWCPESTVQDSIEMIDHVKRVLLHLDYKAYCKECYTTWRNARLKL